MFLYNKLTTFLHDKNLSHGVLTAAFCLPFLIFGSIWTLTYAVTICVGFYIGREHRQHEVRFGYNPISEWYAGFKFWEWDKGSILDVFYPVIVGLILIIIGLLK